ncbi:MAG: translocation/assembly module TamB domain-containing protein [Bacteroidaceae bacterium]|nr:translocation/assembly module TamB domain-containing protein [Bacteroidaceae bacterium]
MIGIVLALVLLVYLFTSLPFFQRWMAGEVASYLSERLDTRVEVGRVQLGLLGHIVVDDLHLWDRQKRPLLSVTRTGVQMEILTFLNEGDIIINSAQLYGAKANIVQSHPDSTFNFQFIVDAFASKDSTKKPLPRIEVNSILVRRTNLTFNREWQPTLSDRIDPNHLDIKDLSLNAALNVLTDDSLSIELDKLTLKEKSGFKLNYGKCKLKHDTRNGWRLYDFELVTPNSRISSPLLTYRNEQIDGSIEAHITPTDFACILPQLAPLQEAWDLNVKGNINEEQISLPQLDLQHENDAITLSATAEINNWRDNSPELDININKLALSSGFEEVTSQVLNIVEGSDAESREQLTSMLSKLEQAEATAHLTMGQTGTKATVSMTSSLGDIEGNGTYDKGSLKAHAMVKNLNLNKLLEFGPDTLSDFGRLTAAFDVDGNIGGKANTPNGQLKANVDELQYRGYTYHDIIANISRKGERYEGSIQSTDPAVLAKADLRASLEEDDPYIQGFADIESLDLHATHLLPSTSIRNLSTRIGIDLQGHRFDNMEGHISIPHLIVQNADTTLTFTHMQLLTQPVGDKRHVYFSSPYLTLKGDGEFDPTSLLAYIQQLGHNWLPNVIDSPSKQPTYTDAIFEARLIDPKPLRHLIGQDIELHRGPLELKAIMQSDKQLFEATASAEHLSLDGMDLQKVNAKISSENRDMHTHVTFNRTMSKAPVDFVFDVATMSDRLTTRINWNSHSKMRNDGEINLTGTLERHTTGGLAFKADLQPSQLHINDTLWNVHPSHINLRESHLTIEKFLLSTDQNERSLAINGIASPHADDELTIDLKNIDLDYVFTIVTLKPISLSGLVSGRIKASQVLKNPVASGNVTVPYFLFNHAHMGLLDAHLSWGDVPGTLSIRGLISDATNNSNLNVNGQLHLVSDPDQYLDLDVQFRRANCAFVNRWVGNFIDDFEGRASGHARIFGTFKDVDLAADAFVEDADFTISALGTRYHIENDSILLNPGSIEFNQVKAYDREGRPGMKEHSVIANGKVTHEHFRRMRFDFNFDANHLLGYDKRDFGDETFYATIYATGNVKLTGYPGRTDINIDATPVGRSSFTYNASGPETITKAKFITFVNRAEQLQEQLKGNGAKGVEGKEMAGDLYINFNMHLTPDAELRLLMDARTSDCISLFGNCNNLYATYYNKGKFQMYGTYHVDHGTYQMTIQDVIHKDFRFRQGGTIVFGGAPFSADLNLQAAYTVPSVSLNDLSAKGTFSNSNVRVDCIMNIGGQAGDPRVTFDFDIPNVNEDERRMVRSLISTEEERNMQVIYLLGIGRFYTYDYSGTQTQSETAMNSLLSSTLSDQLNQMFNRVTNNTNWNFGANLSTGTMGWSDLDVEGMLSGRLLNNRLLINGNFGYRDNPVAASNFIGDFDIQYLLNKSGNVILKAYSETNDRYFTKSALTTQGIGLLIKKDFNRLSDIFGLRRNKKKQTPKRDE